MNEERRHICLGFTDERYPEGTHICYLYNDDEERRRILPLFARRALLEHDTLHFAADVASAAELPRVMTELDLDGAARELPGHIQLETAREAYFPHGEFEPDELLARLRRIYQDALSKGHAGARITGEMAWALRGIPGAERIVECESRLNDLVRETPITVMCQYDLRKFDGATMFEVMQVHPVMIVGGHILRNPFYLHPSGTHEHTPAHRSG